MRPPPPPPDGFLEFMTRWAPVTQFFGPFLVLATVLVALRSAQAARDSAKASQESERRSEVVLSREGRPILQLEASAWQETPGSPRRVRITAKCPDGGPEAHAVRIFSEDGPGGRMRELAERDVLAPGADPLTGATGPVKPFEPSDQSTQLWTEHIDKAFVGHVEFYDQYDLRAWHQTFVVSQVGVLDGMRDVPNWSYRITSWGYPRLKRQT